MGQTKARKRGWTMTTDRLPPVGTKVLVQSFSSSGVVMAVAQRKRPEWHCGRYQRNRWLATDGRDLCYYVEYWRPLPAAADMPEE